MNRLLTLFVTALIAVTFSVALTGCEEPQINNGDDPTLPIPDPEGTVTVSLRNENSGGTSIDGIRIDEADNFSGAYFASLGNMKGLGNVTRIPANGWNDKVAVIPGCGYVAYNAGVFYRIYVDSYTLNSSNEIIGATVRYQYPFCPDGEIALPLTSLQFASSGGSQNILFDNTDIIPFSVTVKEGDDLISVTTSSTLGYSFLTNGIAITASPNTSVEPRHCTVTVTDCSGDTQDIAITIDGVEPYLYLVQDTITLPHTPTSQSHVTLNTNYPLADLTVSSSGSWCEPALSYEYTEALSQMNAALRYVGQSEVTDRRAYAGAYSPAFILLDASPNETGRPRTASVTVASSDGSSYATLKVTQQPFDFTLSQSEVQFERTQSSAVISLSGIAPDLCTVTSDAGWCTFNWGGDNALTLRALANETEADRMAAITVSAKGVTKTIPVYQSRYALLDTYSEDGVTGTVGILTGQNHGKIYTLIDGTYAWSTETVPTGATSLDDGEYNTAQITQIQGYESLYPAFAAVLALNTDGITGWYLPATNEIDRYGLSGEVFSDIRNILSRGYVWTSTEIGDNHANTYYTDLMKSEAYTKTYTSNVIAFRKF